MQGAPVGSNAVRALVLVPMRELVEQVHEGFRGYGRHLPLRTHVVYGGVSINPQMMLRKGLDILIATPGRLLDLYTEKRGQVYAIADPRLAGNGGTHHCPAKRPPASQQLS